MRALLNVGLFLLICFLAFPVSAAYGRKDHEVHVSAADALAGLLFLGLLLDRQRPPLRTVLAEVPFPVYLVLGWALAGFVVHLSDGSDASDPSARFSLKSAGGGAKEFAQFAEIFLCGYLVFRWIPRLGSRPLWTGLVLGCALLSCGRAAAQYFDGERPFAAVSGRPAPGPPDVEPGKPKAVRLTIGFSNHHAYGNFLALLLPLGFSLLLFDRAGPGRWLGGLLAGLGLLTLLSGGALLGIAASTLALAGRRAPEALILAVLGWVVYAGPLNSVLPRKNFDTALDALKVYESVEVSAGRGGAPPPPSFQVAPRYRGLHALFNLVRARPFFGVGLGNYQREIGKPEYYAGVAKPARPIQLADRNTQPGLEVLAAEMGLPQIFLIVGLLGWFGWRAVEEGGRCPDAASRAHLFGAAASLLAFAVASGFSNLLNGETGLWVSFLLAWARPEAPPAEPAAPLPADPGELA